MATTRIDTENPYLKACEICGLSIRILADQPSVAAFLAGPSLQRRAYQCINCGAVICKQCMRNGGMCNCRGNAWVARPYIGAVVHRSANQVPGIIHD